MTRRHLPVALAVIAVLALEVPSFLGVPAVESTRSADTQNATHLAESNSAPAAREVTYKNIVSEVLGEPESVDDFWVNCQVVPCVALTFDDGPGPYTPDVLEILDQFDARATFYPVGQQIRGWPGMLPLIHAAGHDIGNHTMSHPKLGALTVSEQQAEISEFDTLVIDRVGILPTSIRPPFGEIPANLLPDTHSRPLVMWSVDSLDWRKRTSKAIVKEVLADIGAGDIILMHELYQRSVDALPEILTELADRGLTVVSVADLLGPALFRPGLIEYVPFTCPTPENGVEVPRWCEDNPQWRRASR
jgi:peptidoglycan/xylan/chitin deacetylase (PgdA/CDA1 family)